MILLTICIYYDNIVEYCFTSHQVIYGHVKTDDDTNVRAPAYRCLIVAWRDVSVLCHNVFVLLTYIVVSS